MHLYNKQQRARTPASGTSYKSKVELLAHRTVTLALYTVHSTLLGFSLVLSTGAVTSCQLPVASCQCLVPGAWCLVSGAWWKSEERRVKRGCYGDDAAAGKANNICQCPGMTGPEEETNAKETEKNACGDVRSKQLLNCTRRCFVNVHETR